MGQTIALTDGELLEASRRGERDAFGALVERYQHVVCAVSYSRTRDQALSEDVAQETFIAAWKQLDQLREPGRLRSWLCGIARNLARKARRRSDRETPIEEPVIASDANPFDAVSGAQAERVVGEALSRVPDTYRDVLVLYYREGRSVRDVASALGISEAAALQRLARGRQHLADGVTSLVEQSLRAQKKPRRDLAACVVAALPVRGPSRVVEASTVSHGGSMLKLAIAAVAVSAAGTTAYVVHQSRDTAPASSTATLTAPAAPAGAAITPNAPPPVRAKLPTPAPAIAVTQPAAEQGGDHDGPPPTPCTPCEEEKGKIINSDKPVIVPPATIAKLGLERGPSRGPATAPVTIVAFTDMKCKFCGQALGTIDQLFDEYPNKLRLVVKQMPLGPTHEILSQGVYAAEAQGKFWELHDLMLAHQEDLSKDTMIGLAQQAGLDVAKFKTALEQGAFEKTRAADKAAAAELEIRGTPAFFINGHRIDGMMPIATFRAEIDRALAERR